MKVKTFGTTSRWHCHGAVGAGGGLRGNANKTASGEGVTGFRASGGRSEVGSPYGKGWAAELKENSEVWRKASGRTARGREETIFPGGLVPRDSQRGRDGRSGFMSY